MFNFLEKRQIKKQAESDLLEKLRLEKTVKSEIKSIFARMNNDFRVRYSATGQIIDARDYKTAWSDLLRKHYNRVQQRFIGNVERQIKQLTPDQLDELQLALLEYRNERAEEQAGYITKTNSLNMFIATQEARQSLEEQNIPITSRVLALAAAAILKRKNKGRIESIATLETQAPAESTKLFEARSLSGMAPNPRVAPTEQIIRPVKPELTKTWVTQGDKKVRASHVAVNGQTKLITEPYIVAGYQLNYPSDNSLGAPIDVVIGCRCSSVFRRG